MSGDHVIRGQLKTLLDGVHFTSTRIYNVGNGNLIRLSGDSFQMMFDVGYHQRSHPGGSRMKYGAAVRSFQKVIPNAVVLSH